MLPAFFSVMLLIFIRTFESFEIPALVGLPGDIRVLTTSILSRRAKAAAELWQRRRVLRAVDVGRGGDALFLFSHHAGGRPLSRR